MVAKIPTGNNLYGALAYNQEKVDKEERKGAGYAYIREPVTVIFNVAATAEDLQRWMPSHFRCEKPYPYLTHPDPKTI